MGYIKIPIETNPEALVADIFNYIKSQQPLWVENDANLDTWIARATANKAAENRTLLSDVPDTIFQWFGSSIVAIPPVDAQPATGNTTWTLIDNAGHTIPAGTFVGIRNANGDLVTFQTINDVIVSPGSTTTAVGEVLIEALDTGIAASDLNSVPELITVIDWVASIALVAPTSGGVEAETEEEFLDRLTRKIQSLSTVPVLIDDFASATLDASPSVYRAVAIDLYNPLHNLLTANQASAETDATGIANESNATIASTAAQAADGSKSVSLTAIAAADMFVLVPNIIPPAAGSIAVVPGNKYTALASIRANTTVRSCRVDIRWYTAAGALVGTPSLGTAANDSNAAWTAYSVTATAPPTAAFARIRVAILAAALGEVHYVDKMSLRHGTATDWVAGGTAETGNIRTVAVSAVDVNGNAVSSGVKTDIVNYIAARREQNWIVRVFDPKYTTVDVAATVKILPGYTSAGVQASVIAALTTYLGSANWAQDPQASGTDAAKTWIETPTVYYNELITLVSSVAGVDRVTDLTVNVAGQAPARIDVTIDSPAGLTIPGAITCVVV